MGVFEKAGRQFERLKQNVTSAAEQSAGYECAACGTRLFTEQEQCPDCGAAEIVATTTPAEGQSSPTAGTTDSPSADPPASATPPDSPESGAPSEETSASPADDSSTTQTDDSSTTPADADGS